MNYNVPKLSFDIMANSLYVGHETACLACCERFQLGPATWAMLAGKETVGYFCPNCLTETAKQRLTAAAERRQVSQ